MRPDYNDAGRSYSAALQFIIASHLKRFVAMPSAVWSGHLHFGLVAMPVRLLVAARTKTTRFRRLHRKPVNGDPSASFPSFSHDHQDRDSDLNDGIGETRSMPDENARHTTGHQYSTVRQVLQSEVTGVEIRPDEVEVIPLAGRGTGRRGRSKAPPSPSDHEICAC